MKIQIRTGIFETNSSSTHSLIITTKENYNKWVDGELYIYRYGNHQFVTKEEVIKATKNDKYINTDGLTDDEILGIGIDEDGDYATYESFWDCYLEGFDENYTSPSGDEIVVFGQYGYDG